MASWCCRLLCGPVRRVPPWAVYVNHVIMLFRSIDRPSRPALPGWGQEPWGWWVTFAQCCGAGRPLAVEGGRRPPHACGPTLSLRALAFSPRQPVRRRQTDSESQTPRPPSDMTAAVRRSDITTTYSPNPSSPSRTFKTELRSKWASVTFSAEWAQTTWNITACFTANL